VNEVFITEMKNNRQQQYLCITVTHYYTVKMNVLYLIKKNSGNRLQAILLIKFNKLELSNN